MYPDYTKAYVVLVLERSEHASSVNDNKLVNPDICCTGKEGQQALQQALEELHGSQWESQVQCDAAQHGEDGDSIASDFEADSDDDGDGSQEDEQEEEEEQEQAVEEQEVENGQEGAESKEAQRCSLSSLRTRMCSAFQHARMAAVKSDLEWDT